MFETPVPASRRYNLECIYVRKFNTYVEKQSFITIIILRNNYTQTNQNYVFTTIFGLTTIYSFEKELYLIKINTLYVYFNQVNMTSILIIS